MIFPRAFFAFVIAATSLTASPATSRAAAAPSTAPSPANFIVTRLDVADAYLRLDRALVAHPLPNDVEKARVHLAFDQALVSYFNKMHSDAVRTMNELIESVSPDLSRTIEARVARAMRVRVAPWIAQVDRPSPLRVKISPMYALPAAAADRPVKLRLLIRPDTQDAAQQPVFEQEIEVDPSGMAPVIATQQPAAPVGRYRIELVAPDGAAHPVARWFVAPGSMEWLRRANEHRLARVRLNSRQIVFAQNAVAGRNALLSDQLSEAEVSKAMCDPLELSGQLEHEIAELEADRDPFVDRAGEYYRTFLIGSMAVPARVYVPKSVIEAAKPVPLVIALHGAAGEEGQFMDAYGAGRLKKLADEKQFIVVAPSTYHMMTATEPVRALVEELSLNYLIDRSRVYAIGHSLGALTTESYASRFPDQLAAACLLAGAATFPNNRDMSPTLLLLADLDPIFKLNDMNKITADTKRLGLPVETRVLEHTGHALIVNDALPDAVAWMLQHRKQQ
jgi:predicted esterase